MINSLKTKRLHSVDCDIIMGIVMVAMLAFGGTFAYFTATTTAKTSDIKTATVNLSAGDVTFETSALVPGDNIVAAAINYENKSDVKTYVFVKYEVKAKDGTTLPEGITVDDLVVATNLGAGWTDYTETQPGVYYKEVEAVSGEENKTLKFADGIKLNPDLASNSHDGVKGTAMGIELTITLQARSVQFAHVDNVAAAYTAAFGADTKVS